MTTMTAAIPPPRRPYGALELKQHYQKSLSVALLIAAAFHLAAIGGARWYAATQHIPVPPVIDRLPIPPTIFEPGEQIKIVPDEPVIGGSGAAPPVEGLKGIPVPVADLNVENVRTLLTIDERRELTKYGNPAGTIGNEKGDDRGIHAIVDVDVVIPERGTWVFYEKKPEILKMRSPVYPEFAEATGLECDVVIYLFIDADGRIHHPEVTSCSVENLGFEDAALSAIESWVYKPAEQNGNPVGVWYHVPISFRLR